MDSAKDSGQSLVGYSNITAPGCQAVRAMRFDAGANRKKLETAESARERVIAEEELAKAYEEEEGL